MNGVDHEQLVEALQNMHSDDVIKLENLMNSGEWEQAGLLIQDQVQAYQEGQEDDRNNSLELTQNEEFAEWNGDADAMGIH